MTNNELGWKVIKGMNISGPWQEHIVHQAIMNTLKLKEQTREQTREQTSKSQWLDINNITPDDGQRVLTWNKRFEEARIQVFNKSCECWDEEDGDDYEYDLDTNIIQYWMPLPTKPE